MKTGFIVCAVATLGLVLSPMVARAADGENSFTPGTIKSLDKESKAFVMVRTMEDKTTKDINVKTTETTTYSKDGNNLTFADLKVGQTIMCENKKISATERTAVVVKVTAEAPAENPAAAK
jgi:hypothetical protein